MTLKCTAVFDNSSQVEEFVAELRELGANPVVHGVRVDVEHVGDVLWQNATILGLFEAQRRHDIRTLQ